jgi:hypothetical protein
VQTQKKKWRARVIATVHLRSDDGQIVSITPGEYTLSECDGARYQLSPPQQNSASLSLWFGELLQCSYMAQLEILGVWP